MDMLTIIQIGLFVPFLGVLAIFGILYLINGYKNGFGRSLYSLVATVISIGLSLLLAKVLSKLVAGPVTSALPSVVTEAIAELGTLGTSVLQAVIEVILSFLLFALFFVISLAVLKTVSKKIPMGKLEDLDAGNSGIRAAGMSLRGLDAILVSLMLMLPLYGTLAMVAPPAASLVNMVESFDGMDNVFSASQDPELYGQNQPENEGMSFIAPQENKTISPSYLTAEFVLEPNADFAEQADSYSVVEPDEAYAGQPDTYTVGEADGDYAGEADVYSAVEPGADYYSESANSGMEIDPVEILDKVANHPVLLPYKYGPASWVYSGLSSFSMNGKRIDIATAADSFEGMFNRVMICLDAVEREDVDGAVAAVDDLIDYTRNNVIYQQWSYDMVMALVGEADSFIAGNTDMFSGEEELLEMYEQVRPLLDMTFDEYTHNAEGFLDFAAWFVETYSKYGNGGAPEEELVKVENEMYSRIGDLLNHSEQTVGLKQILLQMLAQAMFDTLPDAADPEYADYYAAREGIPNSGAAFVNKYFGDGIVPEDKRTAEGAVFFFLINGPDALDAAEIFVCHPLFGADAVLEAMDENLYINGSYEYLGQQLAESGNSEAICEELDNMLRDYEKASFNQPVDFGNAVYYYLEEKFGGQAYYGDDYQVEYYPDDNVYSQPDIDSSDSNYNVFGQSSSPVIAVTS